MPAEGFIDKLLDVLALLLAEPRTTQQLIDVASYKPETVCGYISKGQEHGLIYIKEFIFVRDRWRAVYAIQPKPFEIPDARPPT